MIYAGNRENLMLNREIESHIRQWDGTIHGYCVKNMYENGADYESICEFTGIDYDDYCEEC